MFRSRYELGLQRRVFFKLTIHPPMHIQILCSSRNYIEVYLLHGWIFVLLFISPTWDRAILPVGINLSVVSFFPVCGIGWRGEQDGFTHFSVLLVSMDRNTASAQPSKALVTIAGFPPHLPPESFYLYSFSYVLRCCFPLWRKP